MLRVLRKAHRGATPMGSSFLMLKHAAHSGAKDEWDNFPKHKHRNAEEERKYNTFSSYLRRVPKSLKTLYIISPFLFILYFVCVTEKEYYGLTWKEDTVNAKRIEDDRNFLEGNNPWGKKLSLVRDADDRLCGIAIVK